MTTSVIICTRNRPNELMRCLESIAGQTRTPNELVIVDGSDDNRLSNMLSGQRFAMLPIMYIHTEAGLTRQRNQGVRASRGDILFFFDDDVVLESDYIEKVLAVYQNETLGYVGGVQGLITNAGRASWKKTVLQRLFLLESPGRGVMRASGLKEYLDIGAPSIRNSPDAISVCVFSGAVMSYRREVCGAFSFDENLSGYCLMEDIDFSYRVSQDYQLYHTSQARAYHLPSFGGLKLRELQCQSVLNHYYLFRRHMAKDPIHILAYIWSNLGRICYTILFSHGQRWTALRGIFEGYADLLRGYWDGAH